MPVPINAPRPAKVAITSAYRAKPVAGLQSAAVDELPPTSNKSALRGMRLLHLQEFLAADSFERCEVIPHQFPDDRRGDLSVFVAQDVPEASNFRPRDFRVASLQVCCEMAACLRDDFEAALYQPLFLPVSFELT